MLLVWRVKMQPNRKKKKKLSLLKNKTHIAHKGAAQKNICSKIQYKVQKENCSMVLKDMRTEY